MSRNANEWFHVWQGIYDEALEWPFFLKHRISILDQSSSPVQDITSRIWDPKVQQRPSIHKSITIRNWIEILFFSGAVFRMELETPNRWRQSRMRWTGIPFRGFTPPTFHLWWYNSSQTDCLPWLVFAINDWLESQISEYNCVIDSLVVDPIQCYIIHIWIWIWLYVQLNANDALIHQYSSNCLQWKEKSTRCFNVTNNFFVFLMF